MIKKKLLATLMSVIILSMSIFSCANAGNESGTTITTDTTVDVNTTVEANTTAEINTTVGDTDTTEVDDTTTSETNISGDISEFVTIKIHFAGSNVADDFEVLQKINKILKEKINAELQPIWGTWGDFDQNSVLSINEKKDTDIYFTSSWSADEYNAFARKGAWVRLDDPENDLIEKYAKDLYDSLPDLLVQGAKTNGAKGIGIYGMPGYKDIATQLAWDINVPLLEKYGYTVDDIKNTDYYGFGKILQKVKEGEGENFYPLMCEGAVLERMVNNVSVVTGDIGINNVLSYYLNPDYVSAEGKYGNKIISKFETEEYKKFVEKTREYYNAGFIDPAMGSADLANDARTLKQLAGEYLIGTQSYAYGYEAQVFKERGFEVAYVPCTEPFVDTTISQGAMMAISSSSKNPERAMMLLNLLNTDAKLLTLLAYGVEGTHYNLNDQGEVVFTEERQSYMPWVNGLGNITLLPPQEGQGSDFQEKFKEFYETQGKEVPYLSYSFDASSVEKELSELAKVAEEYALALNSGIVDPAEKLPEFIEKLKKCGIDKVIEEANKQLEEFMANRQVYG